MGGLGSGKGSRRKAWRSKILKTTSLPALNVPELIKRHKDKLDVTFAFCNIRLTVSEEDIFIESLEGEKMVIDFIKVAKMPCNYGGFRYFGCCPACKRQVRTLYLWKTLFACRHCFRLGYATQNCTLSFRLYLQMKVAKEKLTDGEWIKPKWMRKNTFARLREKYFALDEKSEIANIFSLRNKRIVDKIYARYGSALTAAECWEMHYVKMDYIPKDVVKKYGYTWDFDEQLPAYAR